MGDGGVKIRYHGVRRRMVVLKALVNLMGCIIVDSPKPLWSDLPARGLVNSGSARRAGSADGIGRGMSGRRWVVDFFSRFWTYSNWSGELSWAVKLRYDSRYDLTVTVHLTRDRVFAFGVAGGRFGELFEAA